MKNLVNALKAMADEPRMNILVVLASRGAVCVSHLQEAMRVPQPTVSRYLSILKNAGLLEAERRGQWVYYTLNGEEDTLIIDMIRKCSEQLKESAKIRRIMDRLDKLEQQPSLPASTDNTPIKVRKASKKPAKATFNKEAVAESDTRALAEYPASEVGIVAYQDYSESAGQAVNDEVLSAADETIERTEETEVARTAENEQAAPADMPKKTKRSKKQLPPSLFDF